MLDLSAEINEDSETINSMSTTAERYRHQLINSNLSMVIIKIREEKRIYLYDREDYLLLNILILD
jgi:hypothetical protein